MATKEQLIEAANQADVNRAMAGFFRAHRKERLSTCEANQDLLLSTIAQLVLDPSDPSSYEIAYLKLNGSLVIDEDDSPKPKSVPLPTATPLKDQTPDNSWPKEKIKQYLEVNRAATTEKVPASKVLPQNIELWNPAYRRTDTIELTPLNLKKLDGATFRSLVEKYGLAAIDDRLAGRS